MQASESETPCFDDGWAFLEEDKDKFTSLIDVHTPEGAPIPQPEDEKYRVLYFVPGIAMLKRRGPVQVKLIPGRNDSACLVFTNVGSGSARDEEQALLTQMRGIHYDGKEADTRPRPVGALQFKTKPPNPESKEEESPPQSQSFQVRTLPLVVPAETSLFVSLLWAERGAVAFVGTGYFPGRRRPLRGGQR